jgi:hypothetical protein
MRPAPLALAPALAAVAAALTACSRPAAPPPAAARCEDARTLEGRAASAFAPADHAHPAAPQPDCILASATRAQKASLAITGRASVGSLEAAQVTVNGAPVRVRGGRNLVDWERAAMDFRPRRGGSDTVRVRLEPADPVEGDATFEIESGAGGADVGYGAPVAVSPARRYAVRVAARRVSGDGTFALAFECLRADRTSIGACAPAEPVSLERDRWTEVEGAFDGEGEGTGRLPPGTAFVRPGFRANWGDAAPGATRVARLEVYELQAPAACSWRGSSVEEDAPLSARCRPTEVAQGMRMVRRREGVATASADAASSLALEILCCTLR